jgi:hypothetical protein
MTGSFFYASPEGVNRMDAMNKKMTGSFFHASPEGVNRMDAMNKKWTGSFITILFPVNGLFHSPPPSGNPQS